MLNKDELLHPHTARYPFACQGCGRKFQRQNSAIICCIDGVDARKQEAFSGDTN